jgi:RHS repeat-associated protein
MDNGAHIDLSARQEMQSNYNGSMTTMTKCASHGFVGLAAALLLNAAVAQVITPSGETLQFATSTQPKKLGLPANFVRRTLPGSSPVIAKTKTSKVTSTSPTAAGGGVSTMSSEEGGEEPTSYDPANYVENGKLIRAPKAITALGTDLFGDKVNLYRGTLEFVQTDVSLEGNNQLPVAVTRRLVTGGHGNWWQGLFREWDLEIPHMHGTFSTGNGWVKKISATVNSNQRCTNFGAPPDVYYTPTSSIRYRAKEFWHGNMMSIPGAGTQEVLLRDPATNTNVPTDGQATPLVTTGLWSIRCLPTLASTTASTPTNDQGEGFLAIAPNGTKYRFDWLVRRGTDSLSRVVNIAGAHFTLSRSEVWILPTLITDRFGNTVTYTYDTTDKWKLLNIQSSDGRTLTFTYEPGTHFVQTVTDGMRTWTYGYALTPYPYGWSGGWTNLATVTLPDGSAWNFSGMAQPNGYQAATNNGLIWMDMEYPEDTVDSVHPTTCDMGAYATNGLASPPATGTMVHPSGAVGSFTLTAIEHGRNGVPLGCSSWGLPDSVGTAFYSQFSQVFALTQKTITGPGLSPMTWTTVYDTWYPGTTAFPPSTGFPAMVYVTDPRGDTTRNTFGNTFQVDEGQPLKTETAWNGSTALRTTTTRYSNSFPNPVGISEQDVGDGGITTRHKPVDLRTITQQGTTFTWLVNSFDPPLPATPTKPRPTSITKSSTLSGGSPTSRTEIITYSDQLTKWILGQTATQTSTQSEPGTSAVMLSRTFDVTTANVLTTSRFGHLEHTNTYNTDGTLSTRKDGLNQTTTYSNYKRGLPQSIAYANGTTQSAVVDNRGLITSLTDANGFTTNYGYDTIGRLNLITQPTGDPVTWNSTSLSFAPIASAEYGLPAGHWRQTIATGTGNAVTYVDALWRPVMSRTFDATDEANTRSVVVRAFDHLGHTTYESYPQRDIASITATPAGSRSYYDALGRVTSSTADSELGLLTTSHTYNTGFTKSTIDPRGHITTTSFQAFDQPSESAPVSMIVPVNTNPPENLNVAITRDVFGKPLSITRSGTINGIAATATRSYVYDSNQRLCKNIEPETGATLQDYDLANNTTWRASGTTLTSLNCDRPSVPAASKVSYTYDSLNRLTNTSYADGSPAISRTYTPDSLPLTVSTNGANPTTWTTTYNRRRLPTQESLSYAAQTYNLTRTYDANGNQNQLTYPDATSISTNPNALGQARQVGSYASSVAYHPNGAISSFSYGNGISHSLAQNLRGLPNVSIDVGVLQDVYSYDPNANVSSITDTLNNATTRSMSYDNLDRLLTTVAPNLWGTATYSYDVLDNLRTSNVGNGTASRSSTHLYDSQNRLYRINTLVSTVLDYSYDAQGNITQRGNQGYTFDQGNQLSNATGVASYTYDGLGHRVTSLKANGTNTTQIYSPGGQLLYAVQNGGPNPAKTTKYVYLNRHLLAEVVTGSAPSTTYSHTDGLGSPVAKTNTSGTVVSRTNYEPYGMTINGVPAAPTGEFAIGFTGHVSDAETGLTYMQQRYYDPLAGRFLSEDPVLTDANTGTSFNRYVYANNNPYRFVDPDGREVYDTRDNNGDNDEERKKKEQAEEERKKRMSGICWLNGSGCGIVGSGEAAGKTMVLGANLANGIKFVGKRFVPVAGFLTSVDLGKSAYGAYKKTQLTEQWVAEISAHIVMVSPAADHRVPGADEFRARLIKLRDTVSKNGAIDVLGDGFNLVGENANNATGMSKVTQVLTGPITQLPVEKE